MCRLPTKQADRFCPRAITCRQSGKNVARRIRPGSFRTKFPDAVLPARTPCLRGLLDEVQTAHGQPFLTGFPIGHELFEMGFEFRQLAVEVGTKAYELTGFPDALDGLVENVDLGM